MLTNPALFMSLPEKCFTAAIRKCAEPNCTIEKKLNACNRIEVGAGAVAVLGVGYVGGSQVTGLHTIYTIIYTVCV